VGLETYNANFPFILSMSVMSSFIRYLAHNNRVTNEHNRGTQATISIASFAMSGLTFSRKSLNIVNRTLSMRV